MINTLHLATYILNLTFALAISLSPSFKVNIGGSSLECTNASPCFSRSGASIGFSIPLVNQSSYRVDMIIPNGARVFINYGSPASSGNYTSTNNGQSPSNDFTNIDRASISLRCCDPNVIQTHLQKKTAR